MRLLPVLWLCGPPGVGKTTVGWEIHSRLVDEGVPAGYVDVDQLGICHPDPAADPGRHALKAANLGAVMTHFRAAGARCVVVSGVVEADHGVRADRLSGVALTVCRLRADRRELRERFVGREAANGASEAGSSGDEAVAAVLRYADELDASGFADVCVETGGLSVGEVVGRVRERVGGWPGAAAPEQAGGAYGTATTERPPATGAQDTVPPGGTRALWLCGATGTGKSAVGFPLHLRAARAGFGSAFIDLDQVGFLSPAPSGDPDHHRTKARVLADLWRNYRTAGARRLTIVGPATDEATLRTYTRALAGTPVTVRRLHAGREELTRRILRRGQGLGWAQPGDPLRGRPTAELLRVAGQAAAVAGESARAGIGGSHVDTDGATVAEVADAVAATADWPGRP
ncbi:AAA family ATPase [Streptomyces sp. RK9]|uniref:AAA family ATPase n=1 Tax=Streptomyces sp. RK9 TaxID=3239284 RepID=UPI0038659AF5